MSSSGFPMPKNVFKGVNGDGTSFRVEEWDYGDLAQIEFFHAFFMFIICLAVASIAAPILTLLLLLYVGIDARFRYVFTALLSGYVLYDFYHGWLCLSAIQFFLSDKNIGYLMIANLMAFVVSVLMFVLHPLLKSYAYEPVSVYTEDEYNKLKNGEKLSIQNQIQKNVQNIFIGVLILCMMTFLVGSYIDKNNEGWVKRNIHSTSE